MTKVFSTMDRPRKYFSRNRRWRSVFEKNTKSNKTSKIDFQDKRCPLRVGSDPPFDYLRPVNRCKRLYILLRKKSKKKNPTYNFNYQSIENEKVRIMSDFQNAPTFRVCCVSRFRLAFNTFSDVFDFTFETWSVPTIDRLILARKYLFNDYN